MGTTRSFSSMLNEYLPNRLLREEMISRDYVLQKVQKDDNWKGGTIPVPFKGASASSIKWGALTAENDIASASFVRGQITEYKEVWGSLIFNHTDMMNHEGKIPETTFLNLLPDIVEDFMVFMKEQVSCVMGGKSAFATVTDATNAATGIMIVDHIDRFQLGQKCLLDDSNSAVVEVYVTAINVNTSAVTISATRGGSAYNASAYAVAQGAAFYYDGLWDGSASIGFISMRNALLSAANGGDSTIHGQSKIAYPYLQAINISGSTITATNILDKIFDAHTTICMKAKGTAREVLMSYKHIGSVMKLIEVQKGGYKVVPGSFKANQYGWTEVAITAVTGNVLKFVGIQELEDDCIFFLDWSTVTFRSNGGFRKRKSPDGKEYFEIRATTGYAYIVDTCLFGELEWRKPGQNGVIYGISY